MDTLPPASRARWLHHNYPIGWFYFQVQKLLSPKENREGGYTQTFLEHSPRRLLAILRIMPCSRRRGTENGRFKNSGRESTRNCRDSKAGNRGPTTREALGCQAKRHPCLYFPSLDGVRGVEKMQDERSKYNFSPILCLNGSW